MVDRAYGEQSLAALYDALNPWGRSDDFYLRLVMSARAVLDVGCGTGALLRQAREYGHPGRLCGLDPAGPMLDVARTRTDVEWVRGDLGPARWDREFDLVVMTGHAFQVLVADDELRAGLAAVRSALVDGGRFAFETRNPAIRPWEGWTPEHAVRVTDATGADVLVGHQVDTPVDGPVVAFTTTYTSLGWDAPRTSRSRLRFLDPPELDAFLTEAGLVVDERFGDWDSSPMSTTSPEIITIARRA